MLKSKILPLIEKHERYRTEGINLVVSENHISENVRTALACDLAGRYHASWYGGSSVAQEIVETTEAMAAELFGAKHALVSALSGNLCDMAVLFAFTEPGDRVAMLPFTGGGYPFGFAKFNREHVPLPIHPDKFTIDADEAVKQIRDSDVKLTIMGASCILFPQPVREISEAVHVMGQSRYCVYDGSHVLGLLATGAFQDPLKEGADVLIGSTHKSFYGPQGGLILSNSADCIEMIRKFLELDLEGGIGLVDNPHMNRIAALGLAIEEMMEDPGYGRRIVANAKAIARALDEQGVPAKFRDQGYTESHQVVLDMAFERSEKLCRDLEQVGIFINIGGRIGTSEVTHRGMEPGDMARIAGLMAEVFHHGVSEKVKEEVKRISKGMS